MPAPSASAQTSVVGSWRAGETTIDVNVESWGGDCGPKPTSMHSKGGGVVTIEQKEQALLLHGRDQDIRTDTCWSRNPAMRRNLASYSNGQWLTRCRTADDDSRAEQGTYSLKLQDSGTLLYKDVSRYDWTLNESKCVATFTTTQTLTRLESNEAPAASTGSRPTPVRSTASDAPAATSTTASAASSRPASNSECTPGPAARLSLRPKRAEIELGQRACFRVRVTDADDCALPGAEVTWSLGHANTLRGTLSGGCFTAAESAAEGEGEFRITAKRGNLQAEATVSVRRVDLSSLIARRMEGSELDSSDDNEAVAITPKPVSRIATHVAAPVEAKRGPQPLTIGLGAAALVLTGIGFWVRRKQPLLEEAGAVAAGPSAKEPENSPVARTPTSAPALPASARPPIAAASQRAESAWICPTCRVGYPAQQATCPKDGSKLVPYAEFAQQNKRVDLEHAKRCPACGKTYPASASFCGEDGTNLVSLQ